VPLYEYQCAGCGHRFERIEKVNGAPTKKCPKCGRQAKRLLAPPAIQFKGSGWYVTDYARAGGKAKAESAETSEAKPARDSAAKDSPSKAAKEK